MTTWPGSAAMHYRRQRHHGCRATEWKWRGYDMLSVENEVLRLTLMVGRGCEIVELRHKARDVDVIAHASRDLPILDRYIPSTAVDGDVRFDFAGGGWQVSFPMGFTPGLYAGVHHTVHAEVSALPWDHVVTSESDESVTVEFFCRCRRLPFSLARQITLRRGSFHFLLEEVAQNECAATMEYAWGHHPDIGAPFLTPRCEIDLPAGVITTLPPGPNGMAGRRFAAGQRVESPSLVGTDGSSLSLRHPPSPESRTMDHYGVELAGDGFVAVRNPERGFGFGLTWEKSVFSHLLVWEVSHGGMRQPFWGREYLMAFEPFNVPLGKGLIDLAGKGILPTLAAGASQTSRMRAGFCAAEHAFRGTFMGEPA